MYNRGGAGHTRTHPGFKKKKSQTHLLKLNPIPLGTGRGGYLKKLTPLSSLLLAHMWEFFFSYFLTLTKTKLKFKVMTCFLKIVS